MGNPETFRPTSGYVWAGIVGVIAVFMTAQTAAEGDGSGALLTGAWGVAVSFGAYLLFVRPKVVVFDEGITIVNPLVTETFGWQEVEAVEARYTMYVEAQGRIVHAWAAPAPGRYHSRTVHREDIRGTQLGRTPLMRAGESPRTHSGVATHLARQRQTAFTRRPPATRVTHVRRRNDAGLLLLLGSVAAAVLLGTLHG